MTPRVLIYGGKGALGSKIIEAFSAAKWWTCSVDRISNDNASANVIVQDSKEWQAQAEQVEAAVRNVLNGEKLDAILCVAGGWAGGNAASQDFVQSCDKMWQQSVWTSVIAARLAAGHLKEGGLVQFTGAKAALAGTSGMIGYGMAKAAVHHLVQSLKSKKSGLPKESTVLAILPVTLDTPANRQNMPNADFSSWTPLDFISNLLLEWASDQSKRPASGSLIQLVTKEGKTDLIGQNTGAQ